MKLRIILLGTGVLLLLFCVVALVNKPPRDDAGVKLAPHKRLDVEGLRISGWGATDLRRRFNGDELLVRQFLDKKGRTPRNLIVAATLIEYPAGKAFMDEAYSRFPGHPLVVEYALASDGVSVDLNTSAKAMLKEYPEEASGYIVAALAALEKGNDADALMQIRTVVSMGLTSKAYLPEVAIGRYEYAREFELMDKGAAAKVALGSGGFVANVSHKRFMDYARNAWEASVNAGDSDRADEWLAMGLSVAIASAPSPFLTEIAGNALREKVFVEKMSDAATRYYLNTSKDDILDSIETDIEQARQQDIEVKNMVGNLPYRDYEKYLDVLITRGEQDAYLWLRDNGY